MSDSIFQKANYRKIFSAAIPAIVAAVINTVIGCLQWSQIVPANSKVNHVTFQNFAIYMSLVVGLVVGLIGCAIFLALSKRFQYPLTTRLGVWVGAISGAVMCFSTNLILNIYAPSFDYLRSVALVFISNSLITSIVGAGAGLVAGYVIAQIGSRNLHNS